jgi:hypothetical protein
MEFTYQATLVVKRRGSDGGWGWEKQKNWGEPPQGESSIGKPEIRFRCKNIKTWECEELSEAV